MQLDLDGVVIESVQRFETTRCCIHRMTSPRRVGILVVCSAAALTVRI
jgi:hypothetical protein